MKLFPVVLGIAHSLLKLTGSLLSTWLTLGWKVRKVRKAFEAELRSQGISQNEASRLSQCYSDLKDQLSIRSMMSYFRERQKHQNP